MYKYLFALVDGGGTVPPELGAARRLVERGHRVTVLTEESTREEARLSGAILRPWVEAPSRLDRRPENDPWRDWEVKSIFRLFDLLIETQLVGPAPRYYADVTAAIVDERPDAVVCSQFAFGAMLAAEAAGVPFAVLMPNIYMLPARGLPPMGMGLQPANGPAGRVRDRLIGGMSQRLWDRKGLPPLNTMRCEVGLAPLEHFWDQIHRAERELVMTSPAFDFPATFLESVRYVGPVLDDPPWVMPWQPPPGDDPFVLVSLSSTFQDQLGCLQRIQAALGTLPVRALITTGPAIDANSLGTRANVTVADSAPHTAVLEHADAVITHGGHGTVVKALKAGVPLIVMHHGRDQADNAARVTARGAGVALKRGANPDTIAKAVRKVLATPSYLECARRLGVEVCRDAESGALVDELEAVPAAHAVGRTAE